MSTGGPRYDLAVVGGGLTGLAAAALAASARYRVILLEARGPLGGRALSTSHDGYILNLGPRALYRGPARRVLRRLRVAHPGGPPPTGRAQALYEGRAHPGFMTVPGLLRTPLLGARDRAALAAMLGAVHPERHLRGHAAGEWWAARLPSPRARQAAAALARVATYLGDPAHASAEVVAAQLGAARLGVRYVDGGWRTLVEGLTRAAYTAGVQVRRGQARGLHAEPAGYAVELADGMVVPARTVILAGLPPARAWRLLDRTPSAPVADPVRAACVDLALRRLPRPRNGFVYGVDEPVYLVAHSLGARLAPADGAVIHLVRYDDGTADAGTARARLETLLDEYQAGWRDEVVHQRYLPRLVVAHGYPEPAAGFAGRPDTTDTGTPGVFLAGDWVGRTGLLADAALAGAARAAQQATGYLAGGYLACGG